MKLRRSRFFGLSLAIVSSMAVSSAVAGEWAAQKEYVGLDPYNRPVYADAGPVPIVPQRIQGPFYSRNPGRVGGPAVAGPLYYAEPAPPVSGFYRPDPRVVAGAVLAFDVDAALAKGKVQPPRHRGASRPAPFTGEWFRYCESRYRSFDRDTGTFQPRTGPRRLCR